MGRAQHFLTQLFHFPDVLGSPASLIGSELSTLVGSGPSLHPAPIAYATTREPSESATKTTIPDVWKIGESESKENGVGGDEKGESAGAIR